MVKVQYFDSIQYQYVHKLTASEALLPYIMDNNEDRRVGMLVVWMDEQQIRDDDPLMAITINLSEVLKLTGSETASIDLAHVGFTAATGTAWEKHDILGWHFCEAYECSTSKAKRAEALLDFDYHMQSKIYMTQHLGHSEDSMVHKTYRQPFDKTDKKHPDLHKSDVRSQETDEVNSVHHTFPNTRPWGPPKQHFSTTRTPGSSTAENRATGLGPEYSKIPGTASTLADDFSQI